MVEYYHEMLLMELAIYTENIISMGTNALLRMGSDSFKPYIECSNSKLRVFRYLAIHYTY